VIQLSPSVIIIIIIIIITAILKSEFAALQCYITCVLKIANYHKKLLEIISKHTPESQMTVTEIHVPNALFSHIKDPNTGVHK
jgi:hypothetical protein